jgi:alkylresorcinol/alkylpyrone synthase
LKQEDVAANGAEMFATTHGGFERLAPIYRNALIETRHSCVPIEWYLKPHSFSERNDLFLENAVAVLAEAAGKALAEAELTAQDIDAVVVVCTTGIATPALDARLMTVMPFRPDVRRLPVFGLGCAGGVVGLAHAADIAMAHPDERVLLLVVELCALTFRAQDRSKSNLVATALFGDGAAAAVISCRDDAKGPLSAPVANTPGLTAWMSWAGAWRTTGSRSSSVETSRPSFRRTSGQWRRSSSPIME